MADATAGGGRPRETPRPGTTRAREPHTVLCGGLRPADAPGGWRRGCRTSLEIGAGEDVHLRVEQLTSGMKAGVTDVAMDLLEVASYVFAADQALTRGGTSEFDYGDAWRRRLRFLIPVRCAGLWRSPEVSRALAAALGFLTDDEYEFEFRTATDPARPGSCLFDCVTPDGTEFDEVSLFSGGLDSLCGAVEGAVVGGRRVVLVSHRSATRVWARQRELFEAVRGRVADPSVTPLHVGVTVNKGEELYREFTQRSRSFVFASVAAVVARQVGLPRVRFYENGYTSLNLPVSPELIGARASRTTHPQSLGRFGRLFSLLFDVPFEVQNPYQVYTKSEMLERLRGWGHADLCRLTCSCGHVWGRPEAQPHCGVCSQCVERRIAVLAANLTDADDPPDRYERNPITGERAGPDLTFAERFYGSAREVERLTTPHAFAVRYPEVNEAVPYLGCPVDEAVRLVHDLGRRNADAVLRAVGSATAANSDALVRQGIPACSLLGVALGRAEPRREPAVAAQPEKGLVVDRSTFRVRFDGVPCDLGNTREFQFVERLARARGTYLSIAVLGADVWEDAAVAKNTVQAVACNVRRKFRDCGLPRDLIDGSQKGHYGLKVPPV